MKTKIIIGALVIVVIAFFGGVKYGQSGNQSASTAQNRAGQFAAFSGMRGARTGNGNSGLISGNIIAKGSDNISIKLSDGSSKIALYSPATAIEKTVSGGTGDLATGTYVVVTGTANSDGSISANNIQIRPIRPAAQNGTSSSPVKNQ